jgi:hypothetical protein
MSGAKVSLASGALIGRQLWSKRPQAHVDAVGYFGITPLLVVKLMAEAAELGADDFSGWSNRRRASGRSRTSFCTPERQMGTVLSVCLYRA